MFNFKIALLDLTLPELFKKLDSNPSVKELKEKKDPGSYVQFTKSLTALYNDLQKRYAQLAFFAGTCYVLPPYYEYGLLLPALLSFKENLQLHLALYSDKLSSAFLSIYKSVDENIEALQSLLKSEDLAKEAFSLLQCFVSVESLISYPESFSKLSLSKNDAVNNGLFSQSCRAWLLSYAVSNDSALAAGAVEAYLKSVSYPPNTKSNVSFTAYAKDINQSCLMAITNVKNSVFVPTVLPKNETHALLVVSHPYSFKSFVDLDFRTKEFSEMDLMRALLVSFFSSFIVQETVLKTNSLMCLPMEFFNIFSLLPSWSQVKVVSSTLCSKLSEAELKAVKAVSQISFAANTYSETNNGDLLSFDAESILQTAHLLIS